MSAIEHAPDCVYHEGPIQGPGGAALYSCNCDFESRALAEIERLRREAREACEGATRKMKQYLQQKHRAEAMLRVVEAADKFMRYHATYGNGQEMMELGEAVRAYRKTDNG